MQFLSLYIHWPFCKKKCPYCDFNSHVQDFIQHEDWLNAYLNQLDYFNDILSGKRIKSLFFGGGTPSLMSPVIPEKIIDKLSDFLEPDAEITLEANPTSSDKNKFRDFRAAGINRLSIGVQSLLASELKFLGRDHSSSDAIKAIEAASTIFNRYSLDLIYARPNQTLKAWQAELLEALRYSAGHISLYQLTIEQGTPFYAQHKKKVFTMPEHSLAADMFELTNDLLAAHGLIQYEISNYAKPGHECRHNLCYWKYDEFLGIGPGAHSRVKLGGSSLYHSTVMSYKPEKWLAQVKLNGNAIHQSQKLSISEMATEYILMGLRLRDGLSMSDFKHKFDHSLMPFLNQDKLQYFALQDLLEYSQDHIKLKPRGKIILDHIACEILTKVLTSKTAA
jgi:putative oxygen-independent coproporphyrinogen III oxidase